MTTTITTSTRWFNGEPQGQRPRGHDTFALLQVWLLALALGLCLLARTALAQTADKKLDTCASGLPPTEWSRVNVSAW
jgi:hypothetical protein